MKFNISLFIFLSIFGASSLIAQNTYIPKDNSNTKNFLYNKETNIFSRIQTNGFAIGLEFGKIRTYYKTNFYRLEFGSLKHPREYKSFSGNSGSFISNYSYGKKNSFFNGRVGMGQKRYFSEKARRQGVAIGISYEFGANLGITKPYYLKFNDGNGESKPNEEKFSQENFEYFLNESTIIGKAPFSKGINELAFHPGAHFQVGAHFDWGAFDEILKSLEIGLMGDFYLHKIPILVDEVDFSNSVLSDLENISPQNVKNRFFFMNLYLTLQLGRRK